MKLKKVYSNVIPFKGYIALTFCPWVFIRNDQKDKFTPVTERHETTHALQQIETLWILFFILYGLEYLIKLCICKFNHKKAYRSISFEQEAYAMQYDLYYNKVRKHYAWVTYIFKLA